MDVRKVHCSIVEGLVYEDRCLFKLSKIIEGNKTCENCILRELEDIKSAGNKRKGKRVNLTPRKIGAAEKSGRSKKTQKMTDDSKQSYNVQDLVKVLGRSRRRIQEWAQGGKIPARKVGRVWEFPREEVDQWLTARRGKPGVTRQAAKQKESTMPAAGEPGDTERTPAGPEAGL